jgi:hypothetical protein
MGGGSLAEGHRQRAVARVARLSPGSEKQNLNAEARRRGGLAKIGQKGKWVIE